MRITYIQDQEIYQFGNDYYHSKSSHFFSRYLVGLNDNEKIIVLCGIIEVDSKEEIKKYQKITHDQIQYVKIPNFRNIKNLKKICGIVENTVINSDFCYLRCGIASSIAACICKKKNVPYMSIVNEDVFKNCKSSKKWIVRLSAYPLWMGTRYALKNAKYACYVTNGYLQSKYPTNGVKIGCSDVETLEIDNLVLSKRINKIEKMDNSKYILGIAGSLDAFLKGHDTVIKALKKLNQNTGDKYLLEIVGTGSPKRLKELAIREGVDKQIRFLGEMSHEDILSWMDHLDIYVHPSRSEGLPRTIIEALSRALPCICSNVGGIPELVNSNYLFSYKNKNYIDCLVNLISSMGKNELKEQAKTNFFKSKKYDSTILSRKRNDFFKMAIAKEREKII